MNGKARTEGGLGAPTARAMVVILAFGALVVGGLGWQAWDAHRSQDAAVRRVLADYSSVATWSFHATMTENVRSAAEHLLHPVHISTTVTADSLLTVHTSHDCDCGIGRAPPPHSALRFRLDGDFREVEVAGSTRTTAAELVLGLGRTVREGFEPDWTTALAVLPTPDGPQLVAYTAHVSPEDTTVWGVPLHDGIVHEIFRASGPDEELLPPSITNSLTTADLLAMSVTAPERGELWRSPPDYSEAWLSAPRSLAPRWGGLEVAAAALPATARSLALDNSPRERLVLTAGVLVFTVALLVLALRHVRQVHHLARLRSDFVSSVSHDLRTPLSVQRVAIDTLRLGRARTKVMREQALTDLDRETTRLTGLVGNILRFSSAERGDGLQLRLRPIPLEDVARGSVARLEALIEPDDAVFETVVRDNPIVEADPDALGRAMVNLLENAVKYGPRGQVVRVEISARAERAALAVEDEGPGIPTGEREVVWNPFQRGSHAIDGAVAGSGIGLTVVRDIVRAHGGDATIGPGSGGGTRVEIVLPVVRHAPAEEHAG